MSDYPIIRIERDARNRPRRALRRVTLTVGDTEVELDGVVTVTAIEKAGEVALVQVDALWRLEYVDVDLDS